jgi:hypothetical protein
VAAVILAGLPALVGASPARAQESAVLRTAITLAGEGRSDSARVLLAGELRRLRMGDAAWVEVLFWRGRLAVSGDSAEADLRRVALEFPASPWADDALLELSQLALAAGNPASAYEVALRLRADYPGSPLGPRAALWAARAAFDTGEPRHACALLDSARVEGAADVEFVNQVAFYRGRCTAALLAPPPAAAAAPGAPPTTGGGGGTPAASVQVAPGWYVQVLASRRQGEAADVAQRLGSANLSAHVLAGEDGFHRVRVGPFASEAEAREAGVRARRLVGGEPFVVRVQ